MSFESVKALVEDDLRQVDCGRSATASPAMSSWSTRSPNTSSAAAANACGPCWSWSSPVPAAIGAHCIPRPRPSSNSFTPPPCSTTTSVDGSKLRRGRDTANEVWGNEASVLVGDYVYSRSFEMMVSLESMRIMAVMASATNKIAEGEVLQLLNANDPDTTEERYFEVIYRKTAKLFEAGAQIAAHFVRGFARS